MPIHRLLRENHAFGPDEITVLTSAFDDALRRLRLADRADPAAEVVAKKIIELAQRGERDPVRLSEGAIQALSRLTGDSPSGGSGVVLHHPRMRSSSH